VHWIEGEKSPRKKNYSNFVSSNSKEPQLMQNPKNIFGSGSFKLKQNNEKYANDDDHELFVSENE
jgi:hypothetical protein